MLTFVVALTILTIGVYLGMLLMFKQFQGQAQKEPEPGPMALSQSEHLPPEPRLQAAPGFGVTLADGTRMRLETKEPQAEYRTVLEEWDKNLKGELKDASGNQSVFRSHEAIKKVVSGGGLTARTQQALTKLQDYGISAPTAASSGRVTEEEVIPKQV